MFLRSDSIASATPGYCTLTATARSMPVRSSRMTARWTWPIDAAAIGSGSHSTKIFSGGAPELGRDHLGGELAAHRRRVRLQLGQREANRFGQPVVEVARHLPDLHQGALHVAETLGDVLGGAQLELLVELDSALGAGEQLAGVRGRERPIRCRRPCGPARDFAPPGSCGTRGAAPGPARSPAERRQAQRRSRGDQCGAQPAAEPSTRPVGAHRARRVPLDDRVRQPGSRGPRTPRPRRPRPRARRRACTRRRRAALASSRWRGGGTTSSRSVMTTDAGTLTVGSHDVELNAPERGAGFEHHAPVVGERGLDRPRLPVADAALREPPLHDPAPRRRRASPWRARRTRRGRRS